MNKYILFFLCIFFSYIVRSQFGNEWIDFNRKYYKIPIATSGIYRITYNTLVNAGIPVSTLDPRQFQIFARGKEIPIYVHGENDGVFHSSDYIEFYGKANDAWLDTAVYFNSEPPNREISLFSDTIFYFLTWNPTGINNRRLTLETDRNFTGYQSEQYVFYRVRQNYYSTYYDGETDYYGITDMRYTEVEGWFDAPMSINPATPGQPQIYSKQVMTPYAYTTGPPTRVQIRLCGASNYAMANPDHHIRITFLNQTIDTTFEGYVKVTFNRSISSLLLNNQNTFIFELPADLPTNADRIALSFIEVTYPRQLHLGNGNIMSFIAPAKTTAKSYFQFTGLNAIATDTVLVYDLTNHRRILTQRVGSNVSFLSANTGAERIMFLFANSAVNYVTSIVPVNKNTTTPGFFTDFSVDPHKRANVLMITHRSLWDAVNEYATYRQSTGYQVGVIDVLELYDQFAYGIPKHPLAIRNFVRFVLAHYDDTIRAIYLIGKGFRAGGTSYNYRFNQQANIGTLLPSFGNPPSDILFVSDLGLGPYAPIIPIGRISAKNSSDVLNYLQKVKDYEFEKNKPYDPSNPTEKEWMKKVLHFAGGSNVSEAQMLLSFLNVFRDSISGPFYGGEVTTFTKTSTAPIQQSWSDSIKNLVNRGVSIMNFFAHGAGFGYDISIDDPSAYTNYKRYPFFIANSCYSGDLFQLTPTASESFVLIPNKGAIGYLASSSKSFASYLFIYSRELVGRIAHRNYGDPIGKIIQKTIQSVQYYDNSLYLRDICFGMTLHGDPLILLGGITMPDFLMTPSQVTFVPTQITTDLDSFTVKIVAKNIGRAIEDSIVVEIERIYPDQSSDIVRRKIKAPYFNDTLDIKLAVQPVIGSGLNQLRVTLDAYLQVSESNELNNTANVSFLIISSDAVPIYPYEYAVIPDTIVTLIASTVHPMASAASYVFQIDTIDTFDSPFLKESPVITQTGGILSWTLPFPMTAMPDSTVYYWRVMKVGTGNWRESSFQFIPNKRGWGQAHFFQFKNDDYTYVSFNRPQRRFDFVNTIVTISAQTGYYPHIPWSEEWYKINGALKGQWSCTNYNGHGMKFAVFDTIGVNPWVNVDPDHDGLGPYEALNCRAYPYYDFDFYTTDSLWLERMRRFIDTIPHGYYVLAFSHRNHNAQNYPEELYQAFESIGSMIIRTLPNHHPYIIFGRKGYYNQAQESVGSSMTSIIHGEWNIPTRWKEGHIKSTRIGPAYSWGSLHWRVRSYEAGIWTDSVRLYVLGVKAGGMVDTLIGPLPPISDSMDIYNLSSRIDAQIYPYLHLLITMKDESLHTPAQMVRWQVLYEPVPETAIDPQAHFHFLSSKVQEGDTVRFGIATRNISPVDFPDSLRVSYFLRRNGQVQLLSHKVLRKHPAGDVLIDSIKFSTKGMAGMNSVWVEFNPINPYTGTYYQLEQYHFNNLLEVQFEVDKDRINPILDVTFDGVHILDGDIVSAKPNIEIFLKDENKYLLLTDTSCIRVYLQRKGEELRPVYFMEGGVQKMFFYPPSSSKQNIARVVYPAGPLADGEYKLIVQARDMSGNESGFYDYEINFQVINKPAITHIMNWPNPFSTKTHFVFTLTGSQVPEDIRIQIMTITGRVVREITREELGPIHIGRNITSYAWDGRDQFGEQLANGVYLYRVIVRLNGKSIDHISTEADKYFTHEFGKMVLIR
ncbi:MAG: C25 family cysteine peptidase [Bacteroidales bacterium]|nr:C25 family cysteine peptidase [Bacteroidales bacterium]